MENKPTILVVDDEVKIVEVVKSYLEASGYNALTATTAKEAEQLLCSHPVSLLLLDLMLPDASGEEICKNIRKHSSMPIIMMTAKIEEENIIHGLHIGADDYVTKPFSPRQLMARVAATLRRVDNTFLQGVKKHNTLEVNLDTRIVKKHGNEISLTPNEFQILSLLLSRPNKIFTRDEIIFSCKNDDYDGLDRSIDSHIKNLRQKIEDEPKAPKFILTVYGVGYRFGGDI